MGGDFINAEKLVGKKGRKRLAATEARENHEEYKKSAGKSAMEGKTSDGFTADQDSPNVTVSAFDYSVENHFHVMDLIFKLCQAEGEEGDFDKIELERMSPKITFLREWKQYCYKPRIVKFACEIGCPQGKHVVDGVNLPQFSAANVPKTDSQSSDIGNLDASCKDFVFHAGGPVWALDWCPNVHQRSGSDYKCEYLAVAAHPPESSYHKIGAPLTGRGIVQIWCLLNTNVKEEELPTLKKLRGRPRKKTATKESFGALDSGKKVVQEIDVKFGNVEEKQFPPLKRARGRPRKENAMKKINDLDTENNFIHALGAPLKIVKELDPSPLKKARGRPKKNIHAFGAPLQKVKGIGPLPPKKTRGRPKKQKAMKESVDNLGRDGQFNPVLAAEESSQFLAMTLAARNTEDHAVLRGSDTDRSQTKNEEGCSNEILTCRSLVTSTQQKKMNEESLESNNDVNSPILLTGNRDEETSVAALQAHEICGQDMVTSSERVASGWSLEICARSSHLLKEVALPRVILCLAHNGKVAWDVKWQPSNIGDFEPKHRMGYLAVLLGNGSLEVWEVPSPNAVKFLYSSCKKDGIDPRFVKLEPVFKCSKLKCGDRQSMPLTVEWSPRFPHNLILAGCHDGMVALWKFSASGSPQDTRPLLCFSADTLPIRALAWAPKESGAESANLIATAGHGGLRFWDLRDPYRPLRDLNLVHRVIYSLDWLSYPRCVILSLDDGTLRFLSLSKAAYDVPVTGKPFAGTQQQGLFSYFCSSFPIWSVQASRLTGLVAYCRADGLVLHFQLTTKAVDKDLSRNRAPHFLCGSMTEEDTSLVVNTPVPNIPFPMKKSLNEWGDTPGSIRRFLSVSNQAKRANNHASVTQTLAICYGDDPSLKAGSKDTLGARESKSTKLKSSKKKNADPELACSTREETENPQRGENEKGEAETGIEVFPPKIVAMHRVRWNMNKGSERWLCYGGAAGIVRCQEVPLSSALVRR